MEIISDKKLSLIAKLIVSYVLLLDFAFLIFALTAEPTTDVASVTASLLGWTATLFTPIAAYILYDSWKDQKNYELKKGLIEKIIESVSAVQYSMLKRIRITKEATKITEKLIILKKDVKNIRATEDDFSYHITAYSNISIYEKLTGDDKIRQEYRYFESYCMSLNKLHIEILDIYEDYYKKIDPDLLCIKITTSIISTEYDENRYKLSHEINEMKNLMNGKTTIKYHGKIPIEYSKTYDELIKSFEKKSDDLITILVKELEI